MHSSFFTSKPGIPVKIRLLINLQVCDTIICNLRMYDKEISEEVHVSGRKPKCRMENVNLLTEDEKNYIEICVDPNSYPVNYKGEYHYRSGSTKQQLKGQALNQFLLQKTGITWDSVRFRG